MATDEISKYIAEQLKRNVPIWDIQAALLQVGWPKKDVLEATAVAQGGNEKASVLSSRVFRIGFASIFLINAFTAVFFPNDFLTLVSDNFLVLLTGHAIWYVWFAGVNDLLLGLLILSNKWPWLVYTWASLWLVVVTLAKVIHLLQ